MSVLPKGDLQAIYEARFGRLLNYRNEVWARLCCGFLQRFVPENACVLDLGCGYGQFINQIHCGRKWGMDMNTSARQHLDSAVTFLEQDCSANWDLADDSLDVVFTSNFFEHLPDKGALRKTLAQIYRCLRPGGLIIAVGPNIKYLPGLYWDFWDHYLPLTEASLAEGLRTCGFTIEQSVAKFLPFTMATGPQFPSFLVTLYLRLPWLWRFFGKQFLVVARKRKEVSVG